MCTVKTLSIRQPFAELIVSGVKDVENRNWSTDYHGPILIHTGRRMDVAGANQYPDTAVACVRSHSLGCIVGAAFMYQCTEKQWSPWHEAGFWGFYLADPVRLPEPISWPGQLSLFEIDLRFTSPVAVRCSRCNANLPMPGGDLCGCCLWYIGEYTDRFTAEPARERRGYQDYLAQKLKAAFKAERKL